MRSPGSTRIECSYIQNELGRLALLDLAASRLSDIETSFAGFASIRAEGGRAVFRAGAPKAGP
jgi:hypothetical protein